MTLGSILNIILSMNKPRVTILIPNYNHEHHLDECIQSCLNQTYELFKILIADSSTDGSGKILEKYQNHPKVEVFIKKDSHWRLTQKLNFLLEKVDTEFISTVYSDDIVHETYLETLINFSDKHNLSVAKGNYGIINFDGKIIKQNVLQYEKDYFISEADEIAFHGDKGKCSISANGLFAKTKLVKKVGGWEEQFKQEDRIMNYKLFCAEAKIGFLPKEIYFYRVFENKGDGENWDLNYQEYYDMRIFALNYLLNNANLSKKSQRCIKNRIKFYQVKVNYIESKSFFNFLNFLKHRYHPDLLFAHLNNKSSFRKLNFFFKDLKYYIHLHSNKKLLPKGFY